MATKFFETINHPSNAFNTESNAHESYDKLAWGIEALEADGQVNIISEQGSWELTLSQWKYYFREIRPAEISSTIKLSDGQEIIFGRGPNGQVIDKSSPDYCNIKLALARAMHACGVADIIAEMDWDVDDDKVIDNQPVYFGGPFVPDDTLFRRLENRLLSWARDHRGIVRYISFLQPHMWGKSIAIMRQRTPFSCSESQEVSSHPYFLTAVC